MNYKIINDQNTIQHIRLQQEFTIYSNFYDKTSNITCYIDGIRDYAVQYEEDKMKRNFILLNPFKEGYKKKAYAYLPLTNMLDIDLKGEHSEALKIKFTQDLKCETYEEAEVKFINMVKSDPCVLYFDTSHSGAFKVWYTILSDYYIKHYVDYKNDDEGEIASSVMKNNFNVLLKYVYDIYGLTYQKGEFNYIDISGNKVTQGCFSSWGKNFYINPNAEIIYYNLDLKKINTNRFDKSVKLKTTDIVLKENSEVGFNVLKRFEWLINNDKESVEFKEMDEFFTEKFYNYSTSLAYLNSIKYSEETVQHAFFMIFRMYYKGGGSIDLRSFNHFKQSINKIKMSDVYPLSSLLRKFVNFNQPKINPPHKYTDLNDETDFFGNPYDEILDYGVGSDYISERSDELLNIYNTKRFLVVKAQAGGGKSTFNYKYLLEKLKNGIFKRAVLVIPKNSLLEQLNHIIELNNKYGIPIHKNFDKFNYNGEEGLILSSTPKLRYIKDADILLIDEVQNLVNYSNEIYSGFNRNIFKKIILFSATPEKYLIYETGYYYLYLRNINNKKRIINRYVSKQNNKLLKNLINKDRKQLIFYNNIEESKEKFNSENFDIDFIFVNSLDKENIEIQSIVKKQELHSSHIVTTSYLSDGINFNNLDWDDIIIVENDTLTPDEIYQISNRFRKIDDINIYLISKPRPYSLQKVYDFNDEKVNRFIFNSFSKFKDVKFFNNKCEICIENVKKFNRNDNKDILSLYESDYFIKRKIEGLTKYTFNSDSIKKLSYDKWFLENYKTFYEVQDYALKFYFTLFSYYLIDRDDNISISLDKTDLNELFNNHYKKIVKNDLIIKEEIQKERFHPDLDIDQQIKQKIFENQKYFNRIIYNYKTIEELGVNPEIIAEKATQKSNILNKYITSLKTKKLGEIENSNIIDGLSKFIWDKQEILYRIALTIKQTTKLKGKEVHFIQVQDLVQIFLKNDDLYKKFLDENEENYMFKRNDKSIGQYIRNITRHFEFKSIKRDGKTFKIYVLR